MWQYNDTSELYHWGIKGMKWGQRRYQYKDGTLTPAGKKRYSEGGLFGSSKKKSASKKSTPTDPSQMTTRQLQSAIKRKQLENQLKELNEQGSKKDTVSQPKSSQVQSVVQQSKQNQNAAQGIISKALRNAGEQALTTMAKGAMLYAGSTFVKNALKNPELARAIATGSMGGQKDDTKKDSSSDTKTSSSSPSKEPPKPSASSKSKDDPVNARFREVFNVKSKDVKGEGSSEYKPEPDTVIDVDFRDAANLGKDFINNHMRNQLLLPYDDRDRM